MASFLLFLSRHKEFLITTLVVVVSILFLGYFEETEHLTPALQGFIVAVAVFLFIPVFYCKIVLERPLTALGFQRGNPWAGIGGAVLALLLSLGAFFVLWNFTSLLEGYRLPAIIEEQFLFFVLYELILNGVFLLLFEVFFRGMVMLLWLRNFRIWGVFLQALIFWGIVFLSGDISPQMIPLLLFSPFAGLIAYQSQSLWYSLGASWFFVLIVDALVLILH